MSKDLSPFLKIGVTQTILSLTGKTPSYKEILNKCFIVDNTSLETALTTFDEISSCPDDLLDFKEEILMLNYDFVALNVEVKLGLILIK